VKGAPHTSHSFDDVGRVERHGLERLHCSLQNFGGRPARIMTAAKLLPQGQRSESRRAVMAADPQPAATLHNQRMRLELRAARRLIVCQKS
jgi:hypothetical protein